MKPQRIALFGYAKLGMEVANHLCRTGCELLVVDRDDGNLARAAERGLQTLKCDYTDDLELARAGVGGGLDLIFVLLPEDAENVFLTISARALAPRLTIVAVSDSPGSAAKLLAAGADKVIDPFEIAARRITDLIRKPLVVDMLDQTVFGQADLELAEVEVLPGSGLVGLGLGAVDLREGYELVVIGAVVGGAERHLRFAAEDAGYRLCRGDVLLVAGPSGDVVRFRADFAPPRADRQR